MLCTLSKVIACTAIILCAWGVPKKRKNFIDLPQGIFQTPQYLATRILCANSSNMTLLLYQVWFMVAKYCCQKYFFSILAFFLFGHHLTKTLTQGISLDCSHCRAHSSPYFHACMLPSCSIKWFTGFQEAFCRSIFRLYLLLTFKICKT